MTLTCQFYNHRKACSYARQHTTTLQIHPTSSQRCPSFGRRLPPDIVVHRKLLPGTTQCRQIRMQRRKFGDDWRQEHYAHQSGLATPVVSGTHASTNHNLKKHTHSRSTPFVFPPAQGRMNVMGATRDEKRTWWIPREKFVEQDMVEMIRKEREDQLKMPRYRPEA